MIPTEHVEAFLGKAASSKMESIIVPPVNRVAISARARRLEPSRRSSGGRWLAVTAVALAIIGTLFVAPVSNVIAQAARRVMMFSYFPAARSDQIVMGRTISIDQARTIAKFPFVEPQGLPSGYRLIWVTQAPATAARSTIILRYAPSTSGAGFSVTEMAATPGAGSFACRALRWQGTPRSRPPTLPAANHGNALPLGWTSIPCHGWKIGATEIHLVDQSGKLAPAQIKRIIQSTH